MVTVTTGDELSAAGAARLLGVTPATIRLLCRQGRLAYRLTPLGRLILAQDLERLLAERERKGLEG